MQDEDVVPSQRPGLHKRGVAIVLKMWAFQGIQGLDRTAAYLHDDDCMRRWRIPKQMALDTHNRGNPTGHRLTEIVQVPGGMPSGTSAGLDQALLCGGKCDPKPRTPSHPPHLLFRPL